MFGTESTEKKITQIAQKFVAHRGANNESPGSLLPRFPENSLPALHEAFKQRVTYVECDIHTTLDNQIIVLHDDTLRRTARYNSLIATSLTEAEFKKILDVNVSLLSYKTQLSQVDIGSYADYLGVNFAGTKIPLLSEFLDQIVNFPDRKLVIELKSGDKKIIDLLIPLVISYKLNTDQLIFISFDFELIKMCKEKLSSFQHLFLTVARPSLNPRDKLHYQCIKTLADLEKVLNKIKAANLDGLDLEYDELLIKFIPEIAKSHLVTAVWTYPKDDNLAMAKKMLQAGADLINTNQPEYMFSKLSEDACLSSKNKI